MTASKLALALIAGTLSGAVSATSLTAQEIIQQFNLVSLGNVDSTNGGILQHVNGRSYVAGNIEGAVPPWGGAPLPVYAADGGALSASSYAGLTVIGNASKVQVNNGGAVIVGSLTDSIINKGAAYVQGSTSGSAFNGGTLSSGSPAVTEVTSGSTNFSSVLTGLSTSLSQLSKTSEASTQSSGGWSKTTFNAVAANDGSLAVFNVTSADLAASAFSFTYGSTVKTVIINVDASVSEYNVKIGANFEGSVNGKDAAKYLGTNAIWNFYNAQSIEITAQFGGTILAPSAHLTNGTMGYNGANIEGSVLVGRLTQNAEIHYAEFTGNVTAVPEPESYALMLGGLALMAGIARRRRVA